MKNKPSPLRSSPSYCGNVFYECINVAVDVIVFLRLYCCCRCYCTCLSSSFLFSCVVLFWLFVICVWMHEYACTFLGVVVFVVPVAAVVGVLFLVRWFLHSSFCFVWARSGQSAICRNFTRLLIYFSFFVRLRTFVGSCSCFCCLVVIESSTLTATPTTTTTSSNCNCHHTQTHSLRLTLRLNGACSYLYICAQTCTQQIRFLVAFFSSNFLLLFCLYEIALSIGECNHKYTHSHGQKCAYV